MAPRPRPRSSRSCAGWGSRDRSRFRRARRRALAPGARARALARRGRCTRSRWARRRRSPPTSSTSPSSRAPTRPRRGLRPSPARRAVSLQRPSWRRARTGNRLLARVAARLDLPLAANCTEVRGDEVTRVRWGGSSRRRRASTRPCSCSRSRRTRSPRRRLAYPARSRPSFRLSRPTSPSASWSASRPPPGRLLVEAKVVVSGGRGVGSAEGFAIIELAALARRRRRLLRVVTSAGWRPHSDQSGPDGHEGLSRPLHRVRHQRRDPASPVARARRRSSRSTPTPRRRSSRTPTTP